MSVPLPASVHISVYRGRELTELIAGTDYVRVLTNGLGLPESFERGDSRKGPWVRLEKADLNRRFARNVTAMWDGQRVAVTGSTGDLAHIGSTDRRSGPESTICTDRSTRAGSAASRRPS